jgi:hypothetical protein
MNGQIAPYKITSDEKTMATLAHVLQLVGWWIAPLIIYLFSSIFPRYLRRVDRYFQYYGTQFLPCHLLRYKSRPRRMGLLSVRWPLAPVTL